MKYATFDEIGKVIGHYSTEMHGDNIPSGAVTITEEEWAQSCNGKLTRDISASTWVIQTSPTAEQIMYSRLADLKVEQQAIQDAGLTCLNGIKLQVGEEDLKRWTQLMTGLLAFQPPTITIRDYNNSDHVVTLAVATQMMAEVFTWGQAFLADTWAKKDAIIRGS